jgi:ABC-type multidrug transport system fused ATPase/permease subunit
MKRAKFSISNMLIIFLFIIIFIVLFGGIFTISSIKRYVGNDAFVINELGKIRGSIQRMSKLMLAKRDYSHIKKEINQYFNDIDKRYLNQKLIKQFQNKVHFLKNYEALKSCWVKLNNVKNSNNIIFVSERCWELANKATTAAQKIAEMKKNALIKSVEIIIIVIIFFILILILFIHFLIKKGIEKV